MQSPLAVAFFFLSLVLFMGRRLLTYLHIFQQEEYARGRFINWLLRRRAFDRRASLFLLVLGSLQVINYLPDWILFLGAGIGFLTLAFFEPNPLRQAKKKLVLTPRALRIFSVSLIFLGVLGAALWSANIPLWGWILFVQAVPFLLPLAVSLLAPYEKSVQKRFWNEAQRIRTTLRPQVIGISGSFGKTSVKHIVSHMLSHQAPTLMTPGSVNTPMGIARVLREELKPEHQFFVCEMGAYGPGSIASLCRLTAPDVGIISSLGPAHYERFRSLDTVARAKFELAEAVFDRDGWMVVADQVCSVPYAEAFVHTHRGRICLVGPHAGSDVCMRHIHQTPHGIEVELICAQERHLLKAPLFGLHHGLNLALCFGLAHVLDLPKETVRLALLHLPQITHRLEVKEKEEGILLIDDSYNSNPVGFHSALDLLTTLGRLQKEKFGQSRRILITPGMAELGEAHARLHEEVGRHAAQCVDVLLPILSQRIPSLLSAFKTTASELSAMPFIIPCDDFAQAHHWIEKNLVKGDVILIENDLPDLYESVLYL